MGVRCPSWHRGGDRAAAKLERVVGELAANNDEINNIEVHTSGAAPEGAV